MMASLVMGFGWVACVVIGGLWLRYFLAQTHNRTRLQVAQSECERLELDRTRLVNERENLQRELMSTKENLASITAQKEAFETSRTRLEQTFKALASETLQGQAESFLKLAAERLDKKTTEATGAFDQKTLIFQKLVEPIEKTLSQVQREMGDFEKRRGEQYGQISEQLRSFAANSEVWQKEAKSLAQALRRPEVRGSWGELQLKRVVELAGMSSYCDFEEQVNVQTEAGRNLRPDMIVHLPNKRVLVVDSKAVMSAYLDFIEAVDEEKREAARASHAANIRVRVKELALKAYWDQFEHSPEFAILFIPNEGFLQAACDVDRALIDDAMKDKIIIATPTTLMSLLKAVAYGWQQNQIAENAQKVIGAAKDLYDRMLPWIRHLEGVGQSLEGAMKSYNSAVGSLDSRVLPAARRLKELGLQNSEEIDSPKEASGIRRPLKAGEIATPLIPSLDDSAPAPEA